MNTKRVTKCDTAVFADEIVDRLADEGIAASQHDEALDTSLGSWEGNPGIEILVYEKDFDRARAIVDEMTRQRKAVKPWCPVCGSDDVVEHEHVSRHIPLARSITGVILLFLAVAHFVVPSSWHFFADQYAVLMNTTAAAIGLIGLALLYPAKRRTNWHCNHCGKDFLHLEDKG